MWTALIADITSTLISRNSEVIDRLDGLNESIPFTLGPYYHSHHCSIAIEMTSKRNRKPPFVGRGPDRTVSTCADYQRSLLQQKTKYSWLKPTDLSRWGGQSLSGLGLIECCNRCCTTLNLHQLRVYCHLVFLGPRMQPVHRSPTTVPWATPPPPPQLLGHNAQGPLGVYQGTRELNSAPKYATVGDRALLG